MRRQAQTRPAHIKRDKLALEKHIPVNLQIRAAIALQRAKAVARARRRVRARLREIQQAATDRRHVTCPDREADARQRRRAGKDDAAGLRVVLRARDLRPVGLDDGGVDDQEAGAGICDGGAGAALDGRGGAAANGDGLGGELPEAVGVVDGDGGEGAGELGGVDFAEGVGAGGAVFEVGGEDGLGEVGGDVVEERLLGLGFHGVEFAEGEADQAVRGGVSDEAGCDLGGELDGLRGHSRAADVDGVGADLTFGEGAVAVADVEGRALQLLEGGGFGWVVNCVAGLGLGWELRVEYPQVAATSVEVHYHGLSTDRNRGEKFGVVLGTVRCDGAIVSARGGAVGGNLFNGDEC